MRFLTTLFASTLLCFSNPKLRAQEQTHLECFGVEQGLSQGYVTSMAQDREGFIWAGTTNGLNRFDGRHFRFFKNDPFDSLTLPKYAVSALCDTADFLLIGTEGGGLAFFHKKTERVFRVPFSPSILPAAAVNQGIFGAGEKGEVPGPYIITMLFDAKGSLWLVVGESNAQSCWVCRMDFPAGFWAKLADNPALAQQLTCTRWFCDKKNIHSASWSYPNFLFYDPTAERVLFNYAKQILAFDPSRQRWVEFPVPSELAGRTVQIAFSKTGKHSFWNDLDGKVWRFDGAGNWEKSGERRGISCWISTKNTFGYNSRAKSRCLKQPP